MRKVHSKLKFFIARVGIQHFNNAGVHGNPPLRNCTNYRRYPILNFLLNIALFYAKIKP